MLGSENQQKFLRRKAGTILTYVDLGTITTKQCGPSTLRLSWENGRLVQSIQLNHQDPFGGYDGGSAFWSLGTLIGGSIGTVNMVIQWFKPRSI